eukprot:scaffold3256_cov114-Isochrysis_galbana.AAC.3
MLARCHSRGSCTAKTRSVIAPAASDGVYCSGAKTAEPYAKACATGGKSESSSEVSWLVNGPIRPACDRSRASGSASSMAVHTPCRAPL